MIRPALLRVGASLAALLLTGCGAGGTAGEGADEATAGPTATGVGASGTAADSEAPTGATGPTIAATGNGATEAARGISEDGVVSVGSWVAQSGPLAFVASIADAARLRFEQANDEGGVNGYTFEFTAVDDQADPSQTVNAVRELWEDDEVFALVHPYGTGGLTAVEDYLRDNEVPTLFPFADSRVLFAEDEEPPPDAYGFVPYYADVIQLMMEHAAEEADVETLAVLHTNDPLGQAGPQGAEAAAGDLGIEIIETVAYDSTETNFAPLGRRIAESQADAVLVWSFVGPTQVVQAALESGYEGVLLLHDGYRGGTFFNQLQELPFELDERSYTNVYWTPVAAATEDVQPYVDAFSAAYPEGDVSGGQSGWVAVSLFLEAVAETTADGSPLTWPALRETIESWEDRDIAGSHGITFTDGRHVGAREGKVLRLEGGEWSDATDWTTYARYR